MKTEGKRFYRDTINGELRMVTDATCEPGVVRWHVGLAVWGRIKFWNTTKKMRYFHHYAKRTGIAR